MEVKIDGDTINKYISDAVIKSVLGVGFSEQINKHAKEWLTSYDSPLKNVFLEVVKDGLAEEFKKTENQSIIKDAINRFCNATVLEKLTNKIVSSIMREVNDY